MDRHSAGSYFAYGIILTLVGSIFSIGLTLMPAHASHTNVLLEEDAIDTEYSPGDRITISGTIDDVSSEDRVDYTVTGPGTNDDDSTTLDDDSFEFDDYIIDDGADDGIYTIEVEYDGESAFTYFLIDEDNDDVDVNLSDETFSPGETVEISGNGIDPQTGEDTLEITIEDPENSDDDYSTDTNLDGDEYSENIELADNAIHGKYAVTVDYNGDKGYAIFVVEDDSGTNDPITIELSKSTYRPGENVVISGEVDEVEQGEEVFVTVEDPDGNNVFDDSDEPSTSGSYQFDFNLEDDADTGTYTVTVEYISDDAEDTFIVSSSTTGGSTGGSTSGSGSNSGLTARLSDTSPLAGDILTVTGVVPRIITDEPVNIVVLGPDGRFTGVSSFPDPESDKSYSATLRLPGTLAEDEDYSVVISYDDKDVKILFDITGKASTGGPVSVTTDKPSYGVGSTVRISGEIADDTFTEGEVMALQVYNPDNDLYRVDPITPESDGSYSYSMVVGGRLGVTGQWQVKVTYAGQFAETTFDLTGGVPSQPRYNLIVADKTYSIEYESDGTIKSMFVRPAENMFVVSINAEQDGTLTIVLPREVIDAVQGSTDIKYVVVTSDIDTGMENTINVTESSTTGESRTLVIDYDGGTDLIEIRGTTVVPEFGPLSAIVLAIAVLSVIAVTAKFSNRLSAFKNR